MAVRSTDLFVLLDQIGNDNAAGEYYLPDIIMLPGGVSAVIETEAWEVAGVNSRIELAGVEAMWQARRRMEAMRDGVTLIAPDTVFFSHDTQLARDVVVEPHVVFGPGVVVAQDVTIHAFSHLEGASVESGAAIGPYARLRPGAQIGAKAKVGNFVEIKKATLGEGAKVNHLSYIGDAASVRRPISAQGRLPATMTAISNIARKSARGHLSAPTARWWHRPASARAQSSPRAAW